MGTLRLCCENTYTPLLAGPLREQLPAQENTRTHVHARTHTPTSPPATQEAAPERSDRRWWSAADSLGFLSLFLPRHPRQLLVRLVEQQPDLSRLASVLSLLAPGYHTSLLPHL